MFLLVERGEEDESSGKAVDNGENYSLGLVSKPGGEESNNEAKTQSATKHYAVPDGFDQLDGQWLIPERFLGWVETYVAQTQTPVCGRFEGKEDGEEKNSEVEGQDDGHRNQLQLQEELGTNPADLCQVCKRSHRIWVWNEKSICGVRSNVDFRSEVDRHPKGGEDEKEGEDKAEDKQEKVKTVAMNLLQGKQ